MIDCSTTIGVGMVLGWNGTTIGVGWFPPGMGPPTVIILALLNFGYLENISSPRPRLLLPIKHLWFVTWFLPLQTLLGLPPFNFMSINWHVPKYTHAAGPYLVFLILHVCYLSPKIHLVNTFIFKQRYQGTWMVIFCDGPNKVRFNLTIWWRM